MIGDNLDMFLSSLDAQTVKFYTESGLREVKAYFDNAFFDAAVGETVLDTTQPRLTCKYEDVENIPRETLVEINGKKWSVIQTQPDGTGFAIVLLAHE